MKLGLLMPTLVSVSLLFAGCNQMAALFGREKTSEEKTTEMMNLGAQKLAAGDDKGAQEAYRKAITFSRKNSAPALAMAALYEQRGEDTRAVLELKRAAALLPEDPAPEQRIGELFLRQDRYRAASEAFRKALDKAPTDDVLARQMTIALLGSGQIKEGRREVSRLLGADPSNAENLAIDALVLATEGKVDQARTQLEAASRGATEPGSSRLLGIFYLREGEASAAVQAFKTAVDKGAGDPWTQRLLAQALTESGQGEEAVALLKPILDARPKDSMMLAVYARALVTRGDFEEALKAAHRAVRQNPKLAMGRLAEGDALAAAHRMSEAVQAYKLAIAAAPRLAAPHRRLAAAQMSMGHPLEAAMALQTVVKLAPGDRHASIELLEAYAASGGEPEKAKALAKALLARDPGEPHLIELKLKIEADARKAPRHRYHGRRPTILRGH